METKETLPSAEVMAENVSAVLERATAEEWRAGAVWYDTARETAETIATDSGLAVETVAGIIAAWSPRVRWAHNVRLARETALGGTPAGLGTSRRLAIAVRDDGADVTGPKRRAFAANIRGDETAVTVDVWALRAAGAGRESVTPAQYARVADAYRAAADRFDVTPAVAQAVAWVVVRGAAE